MQNMTLFIPVPVWFLCIGQICKSFAILCIPVLGGCKHWPGHGCRIATLYPCHMQDHPHVELLHCVQVTYSVIIRCCHWSLELPVQFILPPAVFRATLCPPYPTPHCLLHILICLLCCISSFWSRCSALPESSPLER